MALTTFWVISREFTCFNLWPKHNFLVDPKQTLTKRGKSHGQNSKKLLEIKILYDIFELDFPESTRKWDLFDYCLFDFFIVGQPNQKAIGLTKTAWLQLFHFLRKSYFWLVDLLNQIVRSKISLAYWTYTRTIEWIERWSLLSWTSSHRDSRIWRFTGLDSGRETSWSCFFNEWNCHFVQTGQICRPTHGTGNSTLTIKPSWTYKWRSEMSTPLLKILNPK